jgi:predicted SAM-dependent methyltransferase
LFFLQKTKPSPLRSITSTPGHLPKGCHALVARSIGGTAPNQRDPYRAEKRDMPLKLNLGCGHVHAQGWVNVDGSNRAWLASKFPRVDALLVSLGLAAPTEFNRTTFFANLLKRFPWPDNSAEAVYMGEVLEHFTPEQGKHLITESFRVLAPGGIIRVRTPDHARFWRNYVSEHDATLAKPRSDWSQGHVRWTRMYFDDICVRRPKPWQSMGRFHKWGWDEVSIVMLLESAGFTDVRRMSLHQSGIADVAAVETREDLTVEGVKAGAIAPPFLEKTQRELVPNTFRK